MIRPIVTGSVNVELGGQTLEVHFAWTRSSPQTWTQPADPDEMSIERIFLLHEAAEDLSPDPQAKRTLRVDVTQLFDVVGDLDYLIDDVTTAADAAGLLDEYDRREDEPYLAGRGED